MTLPASVSTSRSSSPLKLRSTPTRSPSTSRPTTRLSPRSATSTPLRRPRSAHQSRRSGSSTDSSDTTPAWRSAKPRSRSTICSSSVSSICLRSPGPRVERSEGPNSAENSTSSATSTRKALARALEQHLQLGHDLRRARQRAGGLVQELQLGVAAALGHVRAVGEDQHRRRQQQEQRGGGADRVDGGGRQRQAAVDRRRRAQLMPSISRRVRRLSLPSARPIAAPMVTSATSGRGEHGQQGRGPDRRLERVSRRGEQLEDRDRHAGAERELSDVEEHLHRRDLAVQHQRHGGPDTLASSSSWGARNSRPNTSGSSPSENEFVLRRKWKCRRRCGGSSTR